MRDFDDERRASAHPTLVSRHTNNEQRDSAPSRGDKLQTHAGLTRRRLIALEKAEFEKAVAAQLETSSVSKVGAEGRNDAQEKQFERWTKANQDSKELSRSKVY